MRAMRACWLVTVLLVVACKSSSAPPPPPPVAGAPAVSEEAYARLLIAVLAKKGVAQGATYDADKHAIVAKDLTLNITNLYKEWSQLPADQRDAALEGVVSTMHTSVADEDPPLATAREHLMPVVRAGLYFDSPQLEKSDKPIPAIPRRDIGSATASGIVLDQPTSMRLVTPDDLKRWNLSYDDAAQIALTNLRAHSSDVWQQFEPGLWAAETGDSYDAARLLLVDEIRKLHLRGGAVAMLPTRELLLLAGAADDRALQAMADRAGKLADAPRPIHTIALCLGDHGWNDCEPGGSKAVRKRFHDLAMDGWASIYEEQQKPLQDKVGEDLFVATYTVMENKTTGARTSYATWTKGAPTLLPRADLVAFVDLDRGEGNSLIGMVPWDRVMKLLGAHLHSDGRSPERWATGDYFPSPAELAKLAPSSDL
jgi:uncharacterized protein YtpQ (UPF0354 family)